MRRRVGAAALAVAAASFAACGGDDDGPEALRPVVGDIAPAIAAVEDELGGPQQYFEINATPQFVNLFVAVDDATMVETYLYVDGDLQPPTPKVGAEGPTFVGEDLAFDPDTIIDGIDAELPESDVVVFSVNEGPRGDPQYTATVQSSQGGAFDVTLAPDGETLSVDPLATTPDTAAASGPTPPSTAG